MLPLARAADVSTGLRVPHVRDLAAREQVAVLGHGDAGDPIGVALQEGLVLVVVHVADHDRRPQRVDDVRVVRVQQERMPLHAREADDALELELLDSRHADAPEPVLRARQRGGSAARGAPTPNAGLSIAPKEAQRRTGEKAVISSHKTPNHRQAGSNWGL